MALLKSVSCFWMLLASVLPQDGSPEKKIQELLNRKFDWNATEGFDLSSYVSIVQGHYCEGLQIFMDPVAVPEPKRLTFVLKASDGLTVGEALNRDLKSKGLRFVIWEGIVVITTDKGKEDFEKPDWSGLSAKALEGRRGLSEKLNAPCDFRISPFDPKGALELLSKTSEVPIDATRIPEEPPSTYRGRLLHPAKTSLRVALICFSRATGITFEATEKGLAAVPPKPANR